MKAITILQLQTKPLPGLPDSPGLFSLLTPDLNTDLALINPEIVITDFDPVIRTGLSKIKEIKGNFIQSKIIVVLEAGAAAWVKSLLKIGVRGFLNSNSTTQEIEECFLAIPEGSIYFSPAIREAMLNILMERNKQKKKNIRLSHREKKVADLLKEGVDISDISNLLSLTTESVARLYSSITRKLNLQPTIPLQDYLNQQSFS